MMSDACLTFPTPVTLGLVPRVQGSGRTPQGVTHFLPNEQKLNLGS